MALESTLERERRALQGQDFQALDECATKKSTLVERLDQLERQRQSMLNQHDSGGQVTSMNDLMAIFDGGDTVLTDLWQDISEAIVSCRDLNHTNGAIIRARQHYFDSSLAVLRGSPATVPTYQRTGNTEADQQRRSLVQA